MKKSGVVILSVLLIGALGLIAAVPVSAPTVESSPELSVSDSQTTQQDTESLNSIPADGLVTQNGQTCYYLAGEKQTGLQYIDGKAYIFDESGNMLKSGWYTAEGCSFYLNDSGAGVVKCWRLGEDGKYRYLKADGTMAVNEWIIDYDNIYYVGEDGKKRTGTQTIDGTEYHFDEDGILLSGLIGLQYISGKAYIFDETGHMLKSGWYTANGSYFYLNDNGAGVVNCWRLGEDGKYRYLKADGTMASNEWVVDYGSAYYLAADGKKVTGSMMIDGKNFLFDEDGKLVSGPTGLHYICGRAFIFNQNGEMQKSGRFVADGYTFYLDEMGAGAFSS